MTDVRLFRSSDSVTRLIKNASNDPYENLANAIICVAADDYRMAIIEDDDKNKESLEVFFKSQWYRSLTHLNGYRLMRLLSEEAMETRRKVRRQRQTEERRRARELANAN